MPSPSVYMSPQMARKETSQKATITLSRTIDNFNQIGHELQFSPIKKYVGSSFCDRYFVSLEGGGKEGGGGGETWVRASLY